MRLNSFLIFTTTATLVVLATVIIIYGQTLVRYDQLHDQNSRQQIVIDSLQAIDRVDLDSLYSRNRDLSHRLDVCYEYSRRITREIEDMEKSIYIDLHMIRVKPL